MNRIEIETAVRDMKERMKAKEVPVAMEEPVAVTKKTRRIGLAKKPNDYYPSRPKVYNKKMRQLLASTSDRLLRKADLILNTIPIYQ